LAFAIPILHGILVARENDSAVAADSSDFDSEDEVVLEDDGEDKVATSGIDVPVAQIGRKLFGSVFKFWTNNLLGVLCTTIFGFKLFRVRHRARQIPKMIN
jgi:hypothetical protein